MPFLRILPVVVAGILVANAVSVSLWITVPVLLLSFTVAAIFRRREWSSWATVVALLSFAMVTVSLTATKTVMPQDEKVVGALHITDNPQTSGRWKRATARVEKFRLAGSGEEQGEWISSGEKVVIRFDTVHHIAVGDRIITEARTATLADAAHAGYGRLMYRRGYSASLWVYDNSMMLTLPDKARTPMYYASRMQAAAVERLERLRIAPADLAVAKAMTTGDRGNISPGVRQTYSLTGASHLLAVSGLHVGIVAMLINALLLLIPLMRRGHLVGNIIAIAAIWAYAMLTGLSPSVVRAAMMFSGLQLALFSSQRHNAMNGLLATATIMLLVNPNYLYDVSFQLSFSAVLGIMLLFRPIFRVVESERKWLNAIWSVVIVGVAATVATAPLVSYYFGRIPLIGMIINPVVILTANIIVLFSLLWIIIPVGFLNGVFSFIVGTAAGIQNAVVSFSSSQVWASMPLQFSAGQVVIVYVALAAMLLLRSYFKGKGSDEKLLPYT